jgi:hypothetical protein
MSSAHAHHIKALVEKITALPPDKIAEVEDFIDFLAQRQDDRQLVHGAAAASEPAFAKVWSNPDDDDYNQL